MGNLSQTESDEILDAIIDKNISRINLLLCENVNRDIFTQAAHYFVHQAAVRGYFNVMKVLLRYC